MTWLFHYAISFNKAIYFILWNIEFIFLKICTIHEFTVLITISYITMMVNCNSFTMKFYLILEIAAIYHTWLPNLNN